MPIPTKYVYVTTTYMGYLSAIKQFGPIAHPAKITEEEANALLLAGVDLVAHDPVTKMTYHMNQARKAAPAPKIPDPIKETVLTGAPKSAGDFGISEQTKIEPKVKIDIAQVIEEQKTQEPEVIEVKEELKIEATPVEETVEVSEEKSLKVAIEDMIEMINNDQITEPEINFSDYTKSERRQIRAALNAKSAQ